MVECRLSLASIMFLSLPGPKTRRWRGARQGHSSWNGNVTALLVIRSSVLLANGLFIGSKTSGVSAPDGRPCHGSEHETTDGPARRSRRSLNRMSRSAWSAWSLLPLWGAVGGPKAPASWTHSMRFARFASQAAQPVRIPIERAVAFRPAVRAWFPVLTLQECNHETVQLKVTGSVPDPAVFLSSTTFSIFPSNASSCDTTINCSSAAAFWASRIASASFCRLSASTA